MGTISPLENISTPLLKKLEAMGRISKVKGPPLAIVPDFQEYVNDLAGVEVTELTDFLDAEPADLVEALDMSVDEVAELQENTYHWIEPVEPEEQSWVLGDD